MRPAAKISMANEGQRVVAPVPSDDWRELAHRISGGIEITLYWNPRDDTTSLEVRHHDSEQTLRYHVAPDQALDAFYHPFAHLQAVTDPVPAFEA